MTAECAARGRAGGYVGGRDAFHWRGPLALFNTNTNAIAHMGMHTAARAKGSGERHTQLSESTPYHFHVQVLISLPVTMAVVRVTR